MTKRDGWKWVPITPTDEMLAFAAETAREGYDMPGFGAGIASSIYGSMVSVAPEPTSELNVDAERQRKLHLLDALVTIEDCLLPGMTVDCWRVSNSGAMVRRVMLNSDGHEIETFARTPREWLNAVEAVRVLAELPAENPAATVIKSDA